jgi:protein-S-isoprenylcysteine O-methyltransferase Ste14
MSLWVGYALFVVGNILGVAIRWPHEGRSKTMRVTDDRRGGRELALMIAVTIGLMLLPILAMTPLLSFADHSFSAEQAALGTISMCLYLCLLYRSHEDLGTNWSMTLQVRDNHQLVTTGIYRHIRHPMYAGIYFLVLAQVFLVPNWIGGLSGLVAFSLMFFLRLRPEEQMMVDRFGDAYRDYAARSARLIPGIW